MQIYQIVAGFKSDLKISYFGRDYEFLNPRIKHDEF